MKTLLKAVRGMHDCLPLETRRWQALEKAWQIVVRSYGYQEVRLPILESTQLFKRSIGEVTDIVEKEMFSFQGREGSDSLTLRPEGTAGCVRAAIEHGLLYHQMQRWWYAGPMFRYERPQQGRQRQFHQIGVETLGVSGAGIEVEHILMTARLWRLLGIETTLVLRVNSLGTAQSRQQYAKALVAYFTPYVAELSADNQRRLHSNPLRILDSKDPAVQNRMAGVPQSHDYFDQASLQHFEDLLHCLSGLDIPYRVDGTLVRGLDYYNDTVYEWVTDDLGSQGTVCAGGRYDTLVEQLGGGVVPAAGFAMGVERVLLLCQKHARALSPEPAVYLMYLGTAFRHSAFVLAETLREQLQGIEVFMHPVGEAPLKQQFKQADRVGAQIALILDSHEQNSQNIEVKFLRELRTPLTLPKADIYQFLAGYFGTYQ